MKNARRYICSLLIALCVVGSVGLAGCVNRDQDSEENTEASQDSASEAMPEIPPEPVSGSEPEVSQASDSESAPESVPEPVTDKDTSLPDAVTGASPKRAADGSIYYS